MSIGDPYASRAELKLYVDSDKTTFDDLLDDALDAATVGIEQACDRQFNRDAAAVAREFEATTGTLVLTDDFHTTDGLEVSVDGSTVDASAYRAEPLGGVVNGRPGWPRTRIRFVDGNTITGGRGEIVTVTAHWGWDEVPTPVKQSCLILAAELYKLKDAPFGVAGMDQYGAIRVRENPMVMKKLAPFVRNPVAVA
jgi:hypothetical protein